SDLRARVTSTLRHTCGDSPPQPDGCIGSPDPPPRGEEDSARTGGNLTGFSAICVTGAGVQDPLPTSAEIRTLRAIATDQPNALGSWARSGAAGAGGRTDGACPPAG